MKCPPFSLPKRKQLWFTDIKYYFQSGYLAPSFNNYTTRAHSTPFRRKVVKTQNFVLPTSEESVTGDYTTNVETDVGSNISMKRVSYTKLVQVYDRGNRVGNSGIDRDVESWHRRQTCEIQEWTELKDRVHWRSLLLNKMNLRVPKKRRKSSSADHQLLKRKTRSS
jgi:hypothetical protein